MRGSLLCIVLGLVVVLPTHVEAWPTDPVTIDADVHGADHECPANVPLSCPAAWDSNGTLAPSDDRFESSVFVDEVRITVRPPVGNTSPQEVIVNPRDLVIHHPIYRELNETWLALNDSRPGALTPYVAFESRPDPICNNGEWTEGDWGIFLTTSVLPSSPAWECSTFSAGYCWDYCQLSDETYMQQSDDAITPFPNGLFLRETGGNDLDTHGYVNYTFGTIRDCNLFYVLFPKSLPCDAQPAWPLIDIADKGYQDTTPDATVGFQYNRTSVSILPPGPGFATNLSWENVSWHFPLYREEAPPNAPWQDVPVLPQQKFTSIPTSSSSGSPERPQPPASHQVESAVSTKAPTSRTALLLIAGTAATAFVGAALLLYHRIGKREGLNQETRRRIREAVDASPGLRAAELAAQLGLADKTVAYHLKKMAAWNLVRAGEGPQPRYFPTAFSEADMRTSGALANPTLRAIHAILTERGEMDHSSLAAALKLSLAAVGRAVRKLEAVGLAKQTRVGKRVIVRPSTPEGRDSPAGATSIS